MIDRNSCDRYDLFFAKRPGERCNDEEFKGYCRFHMDPNGPKSYLLHFCLLRTIGATFPDESI